jgi:hypothetical protein
MDKTYITYILRMEANEVLTEQIIETIIEPTIEPILEDVKEPYHDNNWDLVYLRNTRNHYYN